MTQPKNSINPKDLQKFVKNRVDHTYNKQIFEQQLQEQIKKNLIKMQQSIIKQLKRKMIIKEQQQQDLKRREEKKQEIQYKLNKSQIKKNKQIQEKQKKISLEKKHREMMFNQRLSELKQKQIQKVQQKLKEILQKQKKAGPVYNKVNSAISLIQEPHYRKKILHQQSEYQKLKQLAQQKKAFKGPTPLKRRQLSLTQFGPKQPKYHTLQQDRINKMGEHLQKIQQSRKKRQEALNTKIKNIKYAEQQSTRLRNQRMKILMENQKNKQQSIILKLSKSVIPSSSSTSSLIKLNPQKQRKSSEKSIINGLPRGSIIYQQSQQRQKFSYRKQIKQQIKQYMMKQKQRYIQAN